MTTIVFIHYGDSDYLEFVFRLASKFNQGGNVFLLGDANNIRYQQFGIKHDEFKKYNTGKLSNKFIDRYKCLSNIGNNHKVTFDFHRWFILHNFMIDNNFDRCWYFDSDTFICCDLEEKVKHFAMHKLSLINHISGCACLISIDALRLYLELTINLNKNREFVEGQRKILTDCDARKELYSCCDMTIFREYQKAYGPCGELSTIINQESFDPNINIDRANIIEDRPVWEMETRTLGVRRPIKRLYFIDGLPYCHYLPTGKKIRMNTLNMSLMKYDFNEGVFNQING